MKRLKAETVFICDIWKKNSLKKKWKKKWKKIFEKKEEKKKTMVAREDTISWGWK